VAERSLRFGVGDTQAQKRAASWKILTHVGGGKRDVYLACRPLQGAIKLSLHESGQWHFAFDRAQYPELFEEDSKPPTRFLGVYQQPLALTHGITLACRIHTSSAAATVPDPSMGSNVKWIPPAPVGESVEVAVFLIDKAPPDDQWPGRNSMNTRPVGSIELDAGGCVWVVCRNVPTMVVEPIHRSGMTYFKGKSDAALDEPGLRGLGWFQHTDGSIVIQEGPVLI
jgi:hypothetical protein